MVQYRSTVNQRTLDGAVQYYCRTKLAKNVLHVTRERGVQYSSTVGQNWPKVYCMSPGREGCSTIVL